MPIYEFQCKACGVRFERLVRSSSDTPPAESICPDCGGSAQRVFSTFAMHGFSAERGESATEEEPETPARPPITPKEDIERWRRLSKKKS